ncbi:MAG: hypothetical protein ACI4IF_07465 [Acutalibacteraceae bacterium]
MAEDNRKSRKWSLEEIDELLQDSGIISKKEEVNTEETVSAKTQVFNPRPIHDETIDHQIISEKIEKTDSVVEPQVYGSIGSEKYRDRFLNRPIQNLEKTAEHKFVSEEDIKYERSGFIKKKGNFQNTADFSPIPTLVPDDKISDEASLSKTTVFEGEKGDIKEDLGKTKIRTQMLRSLAVTDGGDVIMDDIIEEDDSQLTFEGFITEEDSRNIVDEREVEKELSKKRKEKTETFTITSEMPNTENSEPKKKFGIDEYRTEDDKNKVSYNLKKNMQTAYAGAIGTFLCFGALLAVSILGLLLTELQNVLLLVSLALLIVATAVNFNSLLDGAKSFKGFKFDRNTGSFVSLTAGYIQNIAFLISTGAPVERGLPILTSAAVLPVALNRLAEYFEYKRITGNFEYITSEELYSIGKITKKETAFEIGRGLLLDDPEVLCSQKTAFPTRFLEISKSYYPSDEINGKLIPISFGASVLVGALSMLVTKDFFSGVTAFTACITISVPYFAHFADALAIFKKSSKLLNKGAMMSGWEALNQCESANAVAVDSSDIFSKDGGNVYGIHQFYDMQIDEAILYTASLLINSGGPLGNLFKRVIVGDTSLLPPVESLTYEDKLGLSAWIFNRRILVGNSDLLKNHNVEIPDKDLIERHLAEGRYPLFLAIDGKAAAVFIISYDIDYDNAKLLKSIEKRSISLLVRADDANITDEMLSNRLSLPQSGIKVLSAVSGDIYKAYTKGVTSSSDAVLLHDGRAESFLLAISTALSLDGTKNVLNLFQCCAVGLGVAIVAALSLVSGLESLGAIQLVLIQGFFTALTSLFITGALGGKKSAKPKNKAETAKKPKKSKKKK